MVEKTQKSVHIPVNSVVLEGDLNIPEGAQAVVIFAHGSGSSRLSSRNRFVARVPNDEVIGTLLFDLLKNTQNKGSGL